jgi:hypothetical protein
MDTNQFFYRNAIFSKQGKSIFLIDFDNPDKKQQELEPWFGVVFQLADGQHTLEQLYQYIAMQYNGDTPQNLSDTLKSVVDRMIEGKLIVLTKEAIALPYYLSMPYEMLDIEKAKKELSKDRFNLN